MHAVRRLHAALELARRAGYQVRHEWLDGVSYPACRLGGRKLLFVDLALDVHDQLEQVLSVLQNDPRVDQHQLEQLLATPDQPDRSSQAA